MLASVLEAVPATLAAAGSAPAFWSALSPPEREDFLAVARERTFAGGIRLMREGEQADHVVVILTGRTRISVREEGADRSIVERGPGQLVGERAALQMSVRSASVITLETVRALVMTTQEFADFISAHPAVLDIVERQVYRRLTEERSAARDNLLDEDRPPVGPRHQVELEGVNCTVLLTDVVGFGGRNRNDHDRAIIRRALLGITGEALEPMWADCLWEDRGDGLLVVAPPHIQMERIVRRLNANLPVLLRRHNHSSGAATRIQLRVAVNAGPVTTDDLGLNGEVIIRTARLIDAPAFKEEMRTSGAVLGVIASDYLYDNVIRHCDGGVDPGAYQQVSAHVKESSLPAWVRLFDGERASPSRRGPLIAPRCAIAGRPGRVPPG